MNQKYFLSLVKYKAAFIKQNETYCKHLKKKCVYYDV